MAKKSGKRHGHFCKICGKTKANEKFSGKGHATHVCKQCAALSIVQRNELQRINKVERIAEKRRLTEEEWDLLEKYSKNKRYPELQEYADEVLEYHKLRKPQIEEIAYSLLDNELKEELDDFFYDSLFCFITEKDTMPNEKQLEKITKRIRAAYLKNYRLHITPDDTWSERMKQIQEEVVTDISMQNLYL